MVVTEKITENGRELMRTYSDAGRYVVRDGTAYVEAIDPPNMGRVYTEGDPIDPADIIEGIPSADDATEADFVAALGEFGVEI